MGWCPRIKFKHDAPVNVARRLAPGHLEIVQIYLSHDAIARDAPTISTVLYSRSIQESGRDLHALLFVT